MMRKLYARAHLLGAIVATLIAVLITGAFYDAVTPAGGSASVAVITPEVPAGGQLVLGYTINEGPRSCESQGDMTRLVMTDARGIEYEIAIEGTTFLFVSQKEIRFAVPVPQQAAKGRAMFRLSSVRRCSVLGVYESVHRITQPQVIFTIT